MAKLILVKHAPPEISWDVESPRWVLSEEGRGRCAWLASELGGEGVQRLYSSLEPKALETAALAGLRLGLEVRPRHDLHENDRTGLGFRSAEDLKARIRRFFDEPTAMVMGAETCRVAEHRFEAAIRAAISEAVDQTIAVVTHGTVLTTLVAKYNRLAPFAFWEGLSPPSCVVLDGASFLMESPVRKHPE